MISEPSREKLRVTSKATILRDVGVRSAHSRSHNRSELNTNLTMCTPQNQIDGQTQIHTRIVVSTYIDLKITTIPNFLDLEK